MLIDVSIENFLSVREKVTLSLDSGPGKKLPQNLIRVDEENSLLRSAVLYGANASGKSNIIKAVYFLWEMVVNSTKFNVETRIPRAPFKLDEETSRKPSKFEVRFIQDNVKYRYGFSCDDEKIIEEYLYYAPKGREALIFKRENTVDYKFTIDENRQDLFRKQTIANTLYLSRATQLGYEKTRTAYEFFSNNLIINYSPMWRNYTIRQMHDHPEFKDRILEVMQKADFGGIENIKVTKEKRKTQEIVIEGSLLARRDVMGDFYNIKFTHKKTLKDGKTEHIDFDMEEESGGTQKTLALLGPIFDILENGKVAFIDELEQSLHPEITKFLIKLFHSKHNKKNAQLVFTSQDTNLLDNTLFRKDQIYFCSKEPNKSTELISLLEYRLRQDADIEKAYLNGRFGGLPFIDETLFE